MELDPLLVPYNQVIYYKVSEKFLSTGWSTTRYEYINQHEKTTKLHAESC